MLSYTPLYTWVYANMNNVRTKPSGHSLVEFALISPLLLLFLLGIIQWGWIFAGFVTVRNASAVAARYAVVGTPSSDSIKAKATAAVGPLLNTNSTYVTATVDMNATVGTATGGKRVAITYNLPVLIPFVDPWATNGTQVLHGTTTMW